MEIAAVYLQSVDMESGMPMRKAAESDVHLEADIHALADNANGFSEGGRVPFLQIRYEITKQPSGAKIIGELMPMVASDGPHYGDNVKPAGPGKYRGRYTVYPPNASGNAVGHHFGRHTDRAAGVAPWFEPFGVEWEFTYAGVGKKGGY
ncbi:MAG: iron transporter [Rudaea sp.]